MMGWRQGMNRNLDTDIGISIITGHQISLMCHALGYDSGADSFLKDPYRNSYAASPGGPICFAWDKLCDEGLAEFLGVSRVSDYVYYRVSDRGIRWLLDRLCTAKKSVRKQWRYCSPRSRAKE